MNTSDFFAMLGERAERDTSIIAVLRRSLGETPGTYAPSFPLVEPFVAGQSERMRRMTYFAAGLWALCQRRSSGPVMTFVDALRTAGSNRESASVEGRFVALLDADEDELVWRLRHAVQLLAGDHMAIDWPALLTDLYGWNHPDRVTQQRWARQYWRRPPENSSSETGSTAIESLNQ